MTQSDSLQIKCDRLLKEPNIRFVGFIDPMGNLVAGGFKKGVNPLEAREDRQKRYMEIKLRALTRNEFDSALSPVRFSACRREKLVELSFPINKNVLFVTAEPRVDIEKTAKEIIKEWEFQN